jgi:hypothetical protein
MKRHDALIESIRGAVSQMAAHKHDKKGDLFCLNLSAWIGERGAAIVEHIEAVEAELVAAREAQTRVVKRLRDLAKGWQELGDKAPWPASEKDLRVARVLRDEANWIESGKEAKDG